MAAYTVGFMTHVTCRLTAKNRDPLRNPTLGNRVLAPFLSRPTIGPLCVCVWTITCKLKNKIIGRPNRQAEPVGRHVFGVLVHTDLSYSRSHSKVKVVGHISRS